MLYRDFECGTFRESFYDMVQGLKVLRVNSLLFLYSIFPLDQLKAIGCYWKFNLGLGIRIWVLIFDGIL